MPVRWEAIRLEGGEPRVCVGVPDRPDRHPGIVVAQQKNQAPPISLSRGPGGGRAGQAHSWITQRIGMRPARGRVDVRLLLRVLDNAAARSLRTRKTPVSLLPAGA